MPKTDPKTPSPAAPDTAPVTEASKAAAAPTTDQTVAPLPAAGEAPAIKSKPEHMSSRELLGWLWRGYLRHYMGLLGLAILFMLIEGGTVGGLSYMMQPMFDLVFVAGNTTALFWVSLAFLIIFSMRGLSSVCQKVILSKISQTSAAHMRKDMLARLIRQDPSFHQVNPPGLDRKSVV